MRHHLCDCVWCFSFRSANASVVKQNDLMLRREAVCYCRVPRIHVGVEVSKKEQRNRPCFAEAAERITNAIRLNNLCWCRFMGVIAHSLYLKYSFDNCRRQWRSLVLRRTFDLRSAALAW